MASVEDPIIQCTASNLTEDGIADIRYGEETG